MNRSDQLKKPGLARVVSGLLVLAGMVAAAPASAEYDDGYDKTAQLLTGLAIGAVAGYALIEASDSVHDVHYKGKRHHRGHYHRDHHRHYRGCGHRHDRHYSYYRDRHHYRHDHRHGHRHYHDRHHKRHYDHHRGHRHDKKKYRHQGERHGVYRIREGSSHRGGHERRVTVTHF